jgi:hypothetical protein
MDWLTPTRRAVRWSPLVVASVLAASTLGVIRAADRPLLSDVLTVSLAIVVVGALCGLHDPGRDLVHALPVSAGRRLTHRLSLLVPTLALALVLVRSLATALFSTLPPAPGWPELAAFGAIGVAVCAVCTRRIGTRAVEAAVSGMLVWLAGALSAHNVDLPIGLLMPWWRWPLTAGVGAVVVTVVATTRGVEG